MYQQFKEDTFICLVTNGMTEAKGHVCIHRRLNGTS